MGSCRVHDAIFLRRGTAAHWEEKNEVLRYGEPGWDSTNNVLKIGDGLTPWNDLEATGGGSGTPGEDGEDGQDGEDGDPGPPGPPGAGLSMVERTFASPVTPWVYVHNLNTFAIEVNCVELDGITSMSVGAPLFLDANTIQIDWYYPETGIVRLLY